MYDEIREVLIYVYDCEAEDFSENPSENHVWYIAAKLLMGKEHADKELNDAKNELFEKE